MPLPNSKLKSMQTQGELVSMRKILIFFIPLGLAAGMVSISHAIIQRTLAVSPYPEVTIAGYAIAMSVFTIMERPANLLRQTCTTLVGDRLAFNVMTRLTGLLLLFTMCFGVLIGYSPLGEFVFRKLFHADDQLLTAIQEAYRILMFVTIFSALRCLYQGVIIRSMRTKWLTIGMLVRLPVMYLVSLYFIHIQGTVSGRVGALIFLSGMMVEALVSITEGRTLVRKLPERSDSLSLSPSTQISKLKHVLPFYAPLLYSSFIAVAIGPSINALLGKTSNIQLAIASYALALAVTNIVISFFTYVHQIVLNFYRKDAKMVIRFALLANMIPALIIGLIAYTPLGLWIMGHVMGVSGPLLRESVAVLRVFTLLAFVVPWVDFCNGLVLLQQRTKLMMWSQAGNLVMTVTTLLIATAVAPSWNGSIGAMAQSIGVLSELAVLLILLNRSQERPP